MASHDIRYLLIHRSVVDRLQPRPTDQQPGFSRSIRQCSRLKPFYKRRTRKIVQADSLITKTINMKTMDEKQEQAQSTFGFKWGTKKDTYESEAVKNRVYDWLLERYFGSEEQKKAFFTSIKSKKLLDAGCGNGHSGSLLFAGVMNDIDYLGVDIAQSAIQEARNRFDALNFKGDFLVENIQQMQLDHKFDVIFSEGVIHHTSSPPDTFRNLVDHLNDDGVIMFYVYKKKAPVREFTDDCIRDQLKSMSNQEAWEKLLPLTNLGKKLGELNINISIDEDIDLLQIPKGTYDLQRFFYWYFMKAYYRPEFSIDEMNHINFDWYRPLNCFRYTPEEIEEWLSVNNLEAERFITEDAGITVLARKAKR